MFKGFYEAICGSLMVKEDVCCYPLLVPCDDCRCCFYQWSLVVFVVGVVSVDVVRVTVAIVGCVVIVVAAVALLLLLLLLMLMLMLMLMRR